MDVGSLPDQERLTSMGDAKKDSQTGEPRGTSWIESAPGEEFRVHDRSFSHIDERKIHRDPVRNVFISFECCRRPARPVIIQLCAATGHPHVPMRTEESSTKRGVAESKLVARPIGDGKIAIYKRDRQVCASQGNPSADFRASTKELLVALAVANNPEIEGDIA